jgi:hypothetical protein
MRTIGIVCGLAALLAATGCNGNGACVYTQSTGSEVCVEAGRMDCGGDSYNGTWHAYDDSGSLEAKCRSLGFETFFGSGYRR